MSDILDVSNHKMATIEDSGQVKNASGVVIGRVAMNGDVFDVQNRKVGYFREDGYIFRGTQHVGTVHDTDGHVFDYENRPVGKVVGGHTIMGGAALMLLVR